jgi:coronin-1B/1C/6
MTIKLWDISTGQAGLTLKHTDMVQSLSWSANGAMMVTTSRDKKLRVWDVRQEKPVHEYAGHEGAKNSRAVWLGEHNRIATTGFSRMSERQIGLWEPGRKDPIGGFTSLDSISGVCMPFWGKPTFLPSSETTSNQVPQTTDRTASILPEKGELNPAACDK